MDDKMKRLKILACRVEVLTAPENHFALGKVRKLDRKTLVDIYFPRPIPERQDIPRWALFFWMIVLIRLVAREICVRTRKALRYWIATSRTRRVADRQAATYIVAFHRSMS
jgi:hypothetical protein